MNGQINQIIAETHLNSLFPGLATVLPTPCQNKKFVCVERQREESKRDNILSDIHILGYLQICVAHFALLSMLLLPFNITCVSSSKQC